MAWRAVSSRAGALAGGKIKLEIRIKIRNGRLTDSGDGARGRNWPDPFQLPSERAPGYFLKARTLATSALMSSSVRPSVGFHLGFVAVLDAFLDGLGGSVIGEGGLDLASVKSFSASFLPIGVWPVPSAPWHFCIAFVPSRRGVRSREGRRGGREGQSGEEYFWHLHSMLCVVLFSVRPALGGRVYVSSLSTWPRLRLMAQHELVFISHLLPSTGIFCGSQDIF